VAAVPTRGKEAAMANLTARDVMQTEVHTVREDTSLEEIARLLAERRISGAPVVDEQGRVVGIVSEADLIDEHKREAHIPRVALFGFFPVPQDLLNEAFESGKRLKARDVMSKRVVTASEETAVHELADMMVMRRINRVPIVRDGRLVGIVSRGDLVRAMAQGKDV
jgi:CBS domain-containing protein